jgi:OOP family OmpA-OmpF porin
MRSGKVLLIILCFSLLSPISRAQRLKEIWTKVDEKILATTWTAGLGWNIVDDSGQPWGPKFDASKSWNCPVYFSNLSLEGYYQDGLSFLFNFTTNSYKDGKLINGYYHNGSNFFAYDANAKYDFFQSFHANGNPGTGFKSMIDLFGIGGVGVTYRHTVNVKTVATLNLGFGANIWVYKNWGIQLQALSKFGLVSPFFKTPANYLQYTWGVVYKFKIKTNGVDKTRRMIIN